VILFEDRKTFVAVDLRAKSGILSVAMAGGKV